MGDLVIRARRLVAAGRWGYTRELAEAGHYTQDEADAIVRHANFVTINEVAMRLSEAQASESPRYYAIAEHNPHAGDGWAIYDCLHHRITGGWFVDRTAAEQTAAVLNQQPNP